MTLQEKEKQLNSFLLKVVLGFSFLADSKYEIHEYLKKHSIQIYDHLMTQYLKYKHLYLDFKKRREKNNP